MEKFFSVLTAGGIPYVILSLGAMMLAAVGVNIRFSILIMVPFIIATAVGAWWVGHRANRHALYENKAKLELIALVLGLFLAAHVATVIY